MSEKISVICSIKQMRVTDYLASILAPVVDRDRLEVTREYIEQLALKKQQ